MEAQDKQWLKQTFWNDLCFDLHVESADFIQTNIAPLDIDSDPIQVLIDQMKKGGHIHIHRANWPIWFSTLAQLVTKLHNASIPLNFAFVYDEFWLVLAKLHTLTVRFLDENYLILPKLVTRFIEADTTSVKTVTTNDINLSSQAKLCQELSIWIALTDASVQNSCLYAIPSNRLTVKLNKHHKTLEYNEDLQNVRALPTYAGGFIMWDQVTNIWESQPSKFATDPRISISFSVVRKNSSNDNAIPMDGKTIPSFNERIKLICQSIENNHGFKQKTL